MERREEREGVKEGERRWPGAVNDIVDVETDSGDKGERRRKRPGEEKDF